MADNELTQTNFSLSPEEKRYFGQLFQQADTERLGVVTGEIAVRFFEQTKVPPNVLGEIWQIADTENRGLLTKPGFCIALRLIGHYQAGREPAAELAFRPGPLPKFDGMPTPAPAPAPAPAPVPAASPIQAQGTGIRIPPVNPEKMAQYASLFDQSSPQNGVLGGESAKAIFERAGLPNEILGRIWQLSDRDGKGALDKTEFTIAMHLITCYKSRAMTALPNVLPPALYEAAQRRGAAISGRSSVPPIAPASAIPRQFTGPQARAQSPLARAAFGPPPPMAPQITGPAWLITPQEKAKYDQFFSSIDTTGSGTLNGEQAVKFFSDSGLPEETLASIWDLADIKSEGQLNRDEFAVAMYLIRQQRSGSAPLPAFLPPALVPPSMRNQPVPAPQPTAPTFDNANNSSQLPKSATEDLFGLDEPIPPMPNQPAAPVSVQNTGSAFGTDPFAGGSKPASPTPASPQRQFTPAQSGPSSMFKPFIPSSAFGATLAAQNTGGSSFNNTARSPQPPSAMDDLLGDADNEETKNITEETTELANMSNQIGNLRNQMQDVQTKKTTHDRDLSTTNTQKRDLEQRLAQFRAQYEQEVRAVKALEEQLATSRNETKKLQQEFAMIEGTYQDLQTQHQTVAQALSTDQQENTNLKQRISQLNTEISQLKPQLEKMKADARKEKGMVAINKKQLATNEGEHGKLQTEMGDLKKAAEEREQQERSRSVASPEIPSTVVSPAQSTSTNPFFRQATSPREGGALSPSAFTPNTSAFDALFGPSAHQQQSGTNTPPVTSFRSEPSGPSVSSDGRPTPSASPSLSTNQDEPPPPAPESRQFTPGLLPFRQPLTGNDSVASSVQAAPAGSRMGDTEDFNPQHVASPFDPEPNNSFGAPFGEDVTTPPAQISGPAIQSRSFEAPQDDLTRPTEESMPGAFPEEPLQPNMTGQSAQPAPPDFESAFAGFGEPSRSKDENSAADPFAPVSREVNPPASGGFSSEFPPIQALDEDDSSSDSESERGFDDDFSAPPPPQANGTSAGTSSEHVEHVPTEAPVRPTIDTAMSTRSELPSIEAQASPPSYDQAQEGQHRSGSNNFPPEFTGLLPSREDPTRSPLSHSVPQEPFHTSMASTSGSDVYQDANSRPMSNVTDLGASPYPLADSTQQAAPAPAPAPAPAAAPVATETTKSAFDDDFDDFDDLAEAKEASGDNFDFGIPNREADEFNADFDSPAQSTIHTISSPNETPVTSFSQNGFQDFESNTGSNTVSNHQPTISTAFGSTHAPQAQQSHDWDAIFSGLDTPAPRVEAGFGESSTGTEGAATPKAASPRADLPPLGRALSAGSEHDDPILKRLTGMGYQRQKALDALEKYDYDIDKAVDHLSSN